jgi:hypothetical protein
MPAVVCEWSRRLKSNRDFSTARPGMHEPHVRKSRAAPVGDDKIYLVGERNRRSIDENPARGGVVGGSDSHTQRRRVEGTHGEN